MRHLFVASFLAFASGAPSAAAVSYSEQELAQWTEKANAGDVCAIVRVGLAYHMGNGVVMDRAEAVKWFRLGSERREPFSMTMYATALANGEGGVEKDATEAARLRREALKFTKFPCGADR